MVQKGGKHSPETRERMRLAALARWHGKRKRDLDPVGVGVYSTHEYKEAKAKLKGKPCVLCGAKKRMHTHHTIPGDDTSLIPLCSSCHAKVHHSHVDVKGPKPPPGAVPPLCACGCGNPVKWKRVRGWGEWLRGHGNAKVPAGQRSGPNPLCGCGCKEPVAFRHGKGWNAFKRGHQQRVVGHYSSK